MSFFLADVRDGLGPFLGIFLTERAWKPDDIGLVMTAGGLAGLLVTLPAGVMIDATLRKRLWILICCMVITCATLWPAQVALAWQMARPSITAPIVSATSLEQVDELAKAAVLKLKDEDLRLLSEVSSY